MKKNYTDSEIRSLIKRFEKRNLPKNEWTHEAHLVVAIWYDRKYATEDALQLVRENITRHNESVGTPNSDTEGYHETITEFWLRIAKEFMRSRQYYTIEEACNAFINSEYSDSKFPLEYYSEDVLFSKEARYNWVKPDKQELGRLLVTQ